MDFASEYLSGRVLFDPFVDIPPDKNLELVVIIPAFNEPGIDLVLDSLAACEKPDCSVEILVNVNAPAHATNPELENNKASLEKIKIREKNNIASFRIFGFDTGISEHGWGAGLARKAAMDEAVRRFKKAGKDKGVIVSLDADCKVSENYLTEIHRVFSEDNKKNACSIRFEHPLEGEEYPGEVYTAISLYELHLRYYYQALLFTGYPNVFHTVGSAIAVRADTYVKAGGMNRKQAGEDFYFIQKLIPMGGYFNLNSCTVYPSPRLSNRVPFGTGPALSDIIGGKLPQMMTYNIDAFVSLKKLFACAPELYRANDLQMVRIEESLDKNMHDHLLSLNWRERIIEINNNTSHKKAFVKRFLSWFNMFRIVKYLNHVHADGIYNKIRVEDAAVKLLKLKGTDAGDKSLAGLLECYRKMEK